MEVEIPPVKDHVPIGETCQEASIHSMETYIPCGKSATTIVFHEKDGRGYYMCDSCADHNISNRGGRLTFKSPSSNLQVTAEGKIYRNPILPPKEEKEPRKEVKKEGKVDKNNLVKFQQEESWQARIDEVKKLLAGYKKAQLAELLQGYRDTKDEHEAEIKLLNTRIEAVNQLLLSIFEEEEITKFTNLEGFTFYQQLDVYATVIDQSVFYAWVDAQEGAEDLYTIHPSRASSMIKAALESGEEVPPGTAAFVKSSVRIRKPTKKESL